MSSPKSPRSVLATVAFALIVSAQVLWAEDAAPRDGVFVHVSHGVEDPHRVLMALNMAQLMAESRDVLVYFDVQGVEVVLQSAPDLTFSHFPASKAQLQKLIAMGVGVYACPGCLKAAGKTPADLMPGVKVADKDAFFSFTKGRILTLDY
jgi:predicted peroxiredoxin